MFRNDNQELQDFKRRVNLVDLATSYGYQVVRKESCRTSIVMKNEAQGSKIIVATAEDGHGIFFEVHGDAKGSVIDFVMYREHCTLGNARKVIREWIGQPRPEPKYARPTPVKADRAALAAQWHRMPDYSGGYLRVERGLSDETRRAFSHHVKMDARGNACFRHDDENGLSGWETKNRGFTGFSGGGKKALFICSTYPPGGDIERIVITEAAIDAMSYAQLSRKPGLYVSFSGELSDTQHSQLASLLRKYPAAKVVTATDADAQGEKYAVMIHTLRPDADRARPRSGKMPGEYFKDWNDVLCDKPSPRPQPKQASEASHCVSHAPPPLRTPGMDPSGDVALPEPSARR